MGLEDILQNFSQEVTDFASSSIVHRVEGLAIAEFGGEDVDAQAGDAYLAELLKHHTRAQQRLGFDPETEDIVISTTLGLLLARPIEHTEYIWTVMTGSRANVALTRAIMRKYHSAIEEALPG